MPMSVPVLKPQSQWTYGLKSARFELTAPDVPDMNTKMNDIYRTYGRRVDPSVWAIEKHITLQGDPPFGVTYYLDASNKLTHYEAHSFAAFLRAQGYDPDAYLRSLLKMIQGFGGAVPRVSALSR